ncbi:MAG: extracellular solute-binding protein [Treponema sp.]|nr:extracellular solute-binding protein [Treponema sp.]
MKITAGLVCAAALITLTSCAKKNDRTLYLYNWTYYTPEEVVASFEKEFNCTVKLDSYSTCDEMYAKLRAGAKGYDIVIPSNDFVSIMIKQGMLQEIDQSKLTNRSKINPMILEKADYDPDMKYAVPYALSATGIMVNKTKVKDFNYSRDYDIFEDPQFAGHATMMDEMREVIGCALLYQGKDMNSTSDSDLNEAYELISNKWKPNLAKFDAEGFGKSFASGDFWLCQGYPEIVFGEVDQSRWADTIDFFIPAEGGPATLDSMVILKDAPHPELANEFINYIHRPENYAIFIDDFHYPCVVNLEALQYTKEPSMYDAEQAYNCTLKLDLGDDLDKVHDIWQKIRFN